MEHGNSKSLGVFFWLLVTAAIALPCTYACAMCWLGTIC